MSSTSSDDEDGVAVGIDGDHPDGDRREFLKSCGKFAAFTPPTVTFLLSTSMSSKAIAASGGTITTSSSGGGGGLGALLFGAPVIVGAAVPKGHPAPLPVAATPPPAPVALPPQQPPIPPTPPPPPEAMGERG
ncbi:MAG TPA: hypothetical protein VFS69_06030 [Sphingomicrobium sp.]|nr:hypothetical protein [Sphingomicrobium sp.]